MTQYTSIEQSRNLLNLGLKPETADMCWCSDAGKYNICPHTIPWKDYSANAYYIPCWSVGSLLEVMPPYLFDFSRGIDLNVYRNLNGKGWHVSYMPNNIEDMKKDKFKQITNGVTPLEAAYNMVVWLLENNYIKTE